MTVVVIPFFSSPDPIKLDAAAEEFADAIRFARSESMRTGNPHGFFVWPAQKRIRVYRADMGTVPPTPIYDVYHPVSKKIYTIDLEQHAFVSVDSMSENSTYRGGSCNTMDHTLFDEHGLAHCRDPYPLPYDQGELTFNLGGLSRQLTLDGNTGQVRVQ